MRISLNPLKAMGECDAGVGAKILVEIPGGRVAPRREGGGAGVWA